jgi:hypothetical protein
MDTSAMVAPEPAPADLCACLRIGDIPTRVTRCLLPSEKVLNALVDINADGILLTDRRLILWSCDGPTTTLLLDEVHLECHITGLFALLVISLHDARRHTRTVRAISVHPMNELVNAFSAYEQEQIHLTWRSQPTPIREN